MSLVGPRPELVEIVERYEPWQHQRHLVQPGLTGLWQISRRGEGLMHLYTDVDLEYVATVSLRTDLQDPVPHDPGRARSIRELIRRLRWSARPPITRWRAGDDRVLLRTEQHVVQPVQHVVDLARPTPARRVPASIGANR